VHWIERFIYLYGKGHPRDRPDERMS